MIAAKIKVSPRFLIFSLFSSLIFCQTPARTTSIQRNNGLGVLYAINEGTSSGHLFWDDGNSIDTIGTGSYILVNFEGKQVSYFEYLVVLIVAGYFLTEKYEVYFLIVFF